MTTGGSQVVRATYGLGTPHGQCEATTTSQEVHDWSNEWWFPVHFPRSDYLMKVDTGARVNVMSIADLSRLGFTMRDLTPSNMPRGL